MHEVVVGGRGLIAAVLELVRVADHLGEERRERAVLHALSVGREVNAAVDERPHEREVRLGALPAQLAEERFEPGFVLLLEVFDADGAFRVGHGPWLSTAFAPS